MLRGSDFCAKIGIKIRLEDRPTSKKKRSDIRKIKKREEEECERHDRKRKEIMQKEVEGTKAQIQKSKERVGKNA